MNIVEISSGAAEVLAKLPVDPAKEVIEELIGDSARLWRFKNLIRIAEKASEFAKDRGLSSEQMRQTSMHVGLPWIEKASRFDDETLQAKWAELLLSVVNENQDRYSMAPTMQILEQLDPWDCEVLD